MRAESPVRWRGSDNAATAQEGSRRRRAATHEWLPALNSKGRQEKVQNSWSCPRIRQLPRQPRSGARLRNERKCPLSRLSTPSRLGLFVGSATRYSQESHDRQQSARTYCACAVRRRKV